MRGWPVSRILSGGEPPGRPFLWARRCRRALAANPDPWAEAALRPKPRGVPIRHCSRWGLPCRSCCQSRGGLLPHRFTLTHPEMGGLFSVALSLGLPPPGVTRHRCFMESGLSSTPQLSATRSYGQPRSSSPPRGATHRHKAGAGQSPSRCVTCRIIFPPEPDFFACSPPRPWLHTAPSWGVAKW